MDQTYNQKLRAALVGRRLRQDCMPELVQGDYVFSLWGQDAGIPEDDIHASRAYRIYVDFDAARTITGLSVLVDGELLSPCCGYALEALDELDWEAIRDWCLRRVEDAQ
jgi:hypothetical protein